MTGSQGDEAEGIGAVEQAAELDGAIALDAGVGRVARRVGSDVRIDHLRGEVVAEVEDVVGNAQLGRHAAGVLHVGDAAAAGVGLAAPQLEGDPGDVVTLLEQERRNHRESTPPLMATRTRSASCGDARRPQACHGVGTTARAASTSASRRHAETKAHRGQRPGDRRPWPPGHATAPSHRTARRSAAARRRGVERHEERLRLDLRAQCRCGNLQGSRRSRPYPGWWRSGRRRAAHGGRRGRCRPRRTWPSAAAIPPRGDVRCAPSAARVLAPALDDRLDRRGTATSTPVPFGPPNCAPTRQPGRRSPRHSRRRATAPPGLRRCGAPRWKRARGPDRPPRPAAGSCRPRCSPASPTRQLSCGQHVDEHRGRRSFGRDPGRAETSTTNRSHA